MQTANQVANSEQEQQPQNERGDAAEKQHTPAIKTASAAMWAAEDDYEKVINVAKVIRNHPRWRDEILTWLQQQKGWGNSFATQVATQVAAPTDRAGKAPAANKELLGGLEDSVSADERKQPSHGSAFSRAQAADAMEAAKDDGTVDTKPASAPAVAAKDDGTVDTKPATAPAAAKDDGTVDTKPAAPPAVAAKDDGTVDTKPAAAPVAAKDDGTVDTKPAAAATAAPAAESLKGKERDVASFDRSSDYMESRATVEGPPKAETKGKDEKPEEKADSGQVKITASALRIRAKANFNGQILGKIPRGQTAEVIGRDGVWLHVKFGGLTGYIHSKYTTSVKGNESGEEEEAEHDEASSHQPKQERPKNTTPTNDENNQGVLV